ncbi:hypothetical protein [Sansalvadorimonas verongulae]|uniref:hypothetical protein n=1 Tax=Sansalvadorimonas verongulae TaxID=2172824 RepID=UPI0012BC996F|nr:hypothetical protein [Sansalvadorimonas verongulae]MTI12637.1 hypothetical protein [Sansalvadorimonas verongulae]
MSENKEQAAKQSKATKAKKVCVEFQRSYRSYFPGDKACFPAEIAEELCAGGTEDVPAIAKKVK